MLPLEKLCIDLIVQKFERFHFAFTVSKDINQQRNFEFLQRRYSAKLATELYEIKKLKEEYFVLLVNEHLDFIDGEWFKESRYRNSMADIFSRLPNLTRVCFSDCDDEILKYIATFCPKIIEIDVRGSDVTDNGVTYLCEKNGSVPCPEIKIILIEQSCVTDKGAECLIRNLPLLERFDYENVPQLLYSIHEKELHETGKIHFYNLVELTLSDQDCSSDEDSSSDEDCSPSYAAVFTTCLALCPKLESLSCDLSAKYELHLLTNEHMRKFHLKKLHLMFWLRDVSIHIDNVFKLNGSNLTSLQIAYCTVSISLLGIHCPVLKEFYANYVNFTYDDDVKPNFAFLTECVFTNIVDSSSNIVGSDKALCLLFSSSPKLESVSFDTCDVSLELKTQILLWCKNSSCPKKIVFGDICLNEEIEFLRDILLNCPSLKEMTVNDCFFEGTDSEFEEAKGTLVNLGNNLSNKPEIVIF